MRFALGFIALAISAIPASLVSAEECKVIGQIAYCHDWTKDKPKENGKVDWNSPLKQYGTSAGNPDSYGTLDDAVPPPSYSNDTPLSYPFGNKVDLGNGMKCRRNGLTLDCKQ